MSAGGEEKETEGLEMRTKTAGDGLSPYVLYSGGENMSNLAQNNVVYSFPPNLPVCDH